jgi:hypothetical protein
MTLFHRSRLYRDYCFGTVSGGTCILQDRLGRRRLNLAFDRIRTGAVLQKAQAEEHTDQERRRQSDIRADFKNPAQP